MKIYSVLIFLCLLVASVPARAGNAPTAKRYVAFALRACDKVEATLPQITRVAEIVAARHLRGGRIVLVWNGQALPSELLGRAGGLMNLGDTVWSKTRPPAQDAQNVALVSWDHAPPVGQVQADTQDDELKNLQRLHDAGTYIIGFGSRAPELTARIALCDVFFDAGLGADDRVVRLSSGARAGHADLLMNMLNGWALTGEIVGALTRRGVMPVMWKAYLYPDGHDWSDKYLGKMQFHDDYRIAPLGAGVVARAYLKEIRTEIRRFAKTQLGKVAQAAKLIVAQAQAGRKILVTTEGHTPGIYAGLNEDARWAEISEPQNASADGALVLRLGYSGVDSATVKLWAQRKQRVILMTATGDPRADNRIPANLSLVIDTMWSYGDAVVAIPGYPIRILPPSGIMQFVSYEALSVEVLQRLPRAVNTIKRTP